MTERKKIDFSNAIYKGSADRPKCMSEQQIDLLAYGKSLDCYNSYVDVLNSFYFMNSDMGISSDLLDPVYSAVLDKVEEENIKLEAKEKKLTELGININEKD